MRRTVPAAGRRSHPRGRGSGLGAERPHARRQRQQPATTPTGARRARTTSGSRAANYADGIGTVKPGPQPRYVSNRIFNDVGQNIFSENDVSQWGWVWGQFMDHDFGLRDETPARARRSRSTTTDPLEEFRNDFGAIDFSRTPAAPGTGDAAPPRAAVNTICELHRRLERVYGVDNARLDWLREGRVDGNPANNRRR